jgi:hypothetical protein
MVVNLSFAIWLTLGPNLPRRLPLLPCTSLFILTVLIIACRKVQLIFGSFLPIVDL